MKILFLSDNFPPEVNAPASRTYEHTRRWVETGHEVTVITCAPNFPKGEVHEGYENRWRTVEYVDGIRVVRVKSYIAGNVGFGKRILDYVSFMLSAIFFGLFEKRPDLIVGTSPQFFSAVGAWVLSVLKWRPFVFELRDLWPASIVTVGAMEKGIVIRLLEALELFLYRRASAIIAVTESFVDDLESRGIKRSNIFVIRNGVDLLKFQPRPRNEIFASRLGVEGKFVVAYLGTHGMAHNLGNVIEAAVETADDSSIAYLFIGNGAERNALVQQAADLGLENVVLHESFPKEDMPSVWSVVDVALAHLKDDPVFSTVIPSKIFEAFGMGKPILVVQPYGEAAKIVEEAEAGIWVKPDSPRALADAVSLLKTDPSLLEELAWASANAAIANSRESRADEMIEILRRHVTKECVT